MDSNVNEVITDEMVKEENRLHEAGMQQEKEEMDREEKLLKELTDQSREQRYERLKYLLDKSTMYTEYLVSRIKKQKEEEEKRKKRILNAKIRNATNIKENGSAGKPEGHSSQRRTGLKRKARDEQDKPSPTQKSKHLKKDTGSKSHSQTAKLQTEDNGNCDSNVMTKKTEKGQVLEDTTCGVSQIIDQEPNCGAESDCPEDEPQLIEKATTFGIGEESEEERIINGEDVPFLQPHLMDGGVLRPYQVEGFSWLKVLYENGVNGILADEMGLGKTVQCVAVLSHLVYMGIPGPYLICAPLSTIPNWFSEFQRFAPKIPTVLYHGNKESRAHLSKRIHKKHKIREGVYVQPVVITSYEIAMIDKRFLASHEWKYLIVDEGHRIKNTHCRLVRDLQMYKSTHRLLLTGTPLQNNLAELWSLLNFLLPEIFDDLGSFESWFDVKCMNDIDCENKIIQQERTNSVLSMLHQILSPFMLRRLKSDVDLDIPPKKEILVFAPLTQQQKDFYSALVDRTILSMLDKKNGTAQTEEVSANGRPKRRSVSKKIDYSMLMETKKEQQENKKTGKERAKRWRNDEDDELELEQWVEALNDMRGAKVKKEKEEKTSMVTIKMRNVMMQLRKCCNHPFLLEHPVDPATGELALTEDVITTSGKMLVLDQMLAQLKKRGHRVLIFSQMTRMLDLMEDFCVIRGYNFCRLDGSTSVDDRRDSMSIFNGNTSDKFLFLLSTRAGGLGINLTGADTVIIYDSDWNPQCDLQAQDRCHRIGQNKPVVVYRFVTANTIDQKIIERAAAKRKLEKMVIHKGNFKSGNFKSKAKPITPEELQALLQSKDHDTVVTGGDFIISKTEMNALLDRKDLYEKWEQNSKKSQEEDEKASNKSVSPSATPNKRQSKAEKQSHLFKVMDVEEQQVMSITNESPKTEVADH